MSKTVSSRYQNRRKGLVLLRKGLGIRGFIQFMQDFGLNEGDYTKERDKWLKEKNVDEVLDNLKNKNIRI
jgi:hypothetical protein